MVIQISNNHCEWNAPRISKPGNDLYYKGKIIEKLFHPKHLPASKIVDSNDIPDFQVSSII